MQDKLIDAAIAAVYEETAAMMKRGFSDLSIQADVMQSCSDTIAKILKLKSQSQAEVKSGIIPPYIATTDTNRVNLSALCGDVAKEDISTGYFPSQKLLGKTQNERSGY